MNDILINHNLLKKLPDHLIRENIMPFTYNLQNQCILEDIKSFYNTRSYLLNLYYDRWRHTFEYEEYADLNWLDNDISRYMNNDIATMTGYTISNLNKFKRVFLLQNKDYETISKYITLGRGPSNDVKQNINILIGILLPCERNELIEFTESINN